MSKIKELTEEAYRLRVTAAASISAGDIIVDDGLAEMCRKPYCKNFGMSKSRPPHVAGPSGFRKQIEKCNQAIFFKIDVPKDDLYSGESRELFQLLHQVAAGIEAAALQMGFSNAWAYAGGSCKKIFCYDHPDCPALTEKNTCRHPQWARPSMSGFGVDVSELFKTAGWKMNWVTHGVDSNPTRMASICGLVLIKR